ncbi:MAG: hypothetical protein ACFFD7_10350, partial [Candidatus Thorarchaeota archaeon]
VEKLPNHCNKPMHIEGDKLVCWMGEHCGSQPIPKHCGKQMVIVPKSMKATKKYSLSRIDKEELKSKECNEIIDVPNHDNEPMHIEKDQ